jgi:NTE family protein/lysophospholipid hydrolase
MLNFLESVPFFQSLQEADLQRLAAGIEQVSLPAGAFLFREGEPGDSCYVVRSGTLQVLVALASGEQQPIATLGAAEVVGEMAVLHGRPRAATVQATTAATVLKLSAVVLEDLFSSNPSARAHLLDIATRRLPSLYLTSVPIFAGLDRKTLAELDIAANWVSIAGGQTLFSQGDPADYLYIVVRGRLEVVVARDDGGIEVVGQLGRGAVVGEVALLSGEPRGASVRAIRDSELVRLSKNALHALIQRQPSTALEMLRVLSSRVRPVPPAHRHTLVSTIAIVPPEHGAFTAGWTERLVEALTSVDGPTLHVTRRRIEQEVGGPSETFLEDERSRAAVRRWLHEQEDLVRYIVFECDPTSSPWTDLCLRHADLVLIAVVAQASPSDATLPRRILAKQTDTRRVPAELLLLHPDGATPPSGTARWLNEIPVTRHHHVRLDRTDDFARVARLIAGKAVSVAFSGGGARALAHIGVVQALQESGIPIDAVAGVSAGCFVSAFYASGHDPDKMLAITNRSIGSYRPIREATFPMVGFLSGRASVNMFRQEFDTDIEDLWLPFLCLSANLSRVALVIHDRGSLWKAVRASTSVPGIYSPVCLNGELLVDGGVLNNLPADVLRTRYNGTVIASDVSMAVDLTTDTAELTAISGWPLFWSVLNPFGKKRTVPHLFEILMRTATLSSTHHGASIAASADLYMRLPVDGVATLDWAAGPLLVERSYRYALSQIETWKEAGGSWQ